MHIARWSRASLTLCGSSAFSTACPLHTVIAINVAIIITGLKDGGDDCFNVMDEPTILVSLVFNFVLGKCAIPETGKEAHILKRWRTPRSRAIVYLEQAASKCTAILRARDA